ncbi:hypothetical protein ACJJTC_012440, partial [Scirpophaga incertulas]
MLVKILFVCMFVTVGISEKIRYDNYALYKVHTENDEDVKHLAELQENYKELDFWKTATKAGDYASVVISPVFREQFERSLKKRSIQSDLMVENIQEAFDAQLASRRKRDTRDGLYWTGYQTMEDINNWFNSLVQNNSNVVSLINLGMTYEDRNITGVRISRGAGNRHIVLEAGEIAADWLSPTVLTYIINELVQGTDPEAKAASENFVWHIFPLLNPDGHEYTQNYDRLWIKNRTFKRAAWEVNLSKNWNSQWGIIGANFTGESNDFAGHGPFSESETRFLSRYIESISENLVGFFSFRGFGQRLLIPFAHTTEPLYNYNEMVSTNANVSRTSIVIFL